MRLSKLKLAVVLALVALLSLAGIAAADTSGEAAVDVFDFDYSPDPVTISVGDTVTWSDPAGGQRHNVLSIDGGPINSGEPSNDGWTYSLQFNVAGTYNYICELHGESDDPESMYGTVIVGAPTAVTLGSLATIPATSPALWVLGAGLLGLGALAGLGALRRR